jgi:hypothetical protein
MGTSIKARLEQMKTPALMVVSLLVLITASFILGQGLMYLIQGAQASLPAWEEITPDCKQVHIVLPGSDSFYGNLCIMPGGQMVCLFSHDEKINLCYPNPGVTHEQAIR